MNSINKDAAFHLSAYKHCIVIALLVAIVYVPVLFFPYLLLDDNWLVRRSNGVPALDYIAALQGRPVFAVMIRLMRILTSNSDSPTHVMAVITLVRGLAIVGLCGFAVGLFKWLVQWGSSLRSAFLTATVTATLPSLAMYVLGGPWLTVALVGSLVSVYLILHAVQATDRLHFALWSLLALGAQILCWATYQGTAPVAAALILVVFIGSTKEDWDFTRRWSSLSQRARFVLLGSAVFLLGLSAYIVLWKIVFYLLYAGIKETRYSPSSINILNTTVINHFFHLRLIQIMNLWSVEGLLKTVFFWLSLLATVLAIAKDIVGKSKRFGTTKWIVILLALILVDLPALSGNSSAGVPSPIYSYMTSGALAVAFAGIYSYKFFPLIADGTGRRQGLLIGIVLAVALTLCMKRVLTNFAVPLWLEYRYVRSEIEHFKAVHGSVEGVRISERRLPLLSTGVQEFSWSNLQSSFYVHWMVRNALDDLKLKSNIKIEITILSGQVLTSPSYDREPDASKVVTIDATHLRLNR